MDDFTTEVWRLSGATGSTPGSMTLQDGTVTLHLVRPDDEVDQMFSVPIDAVTSVKWPKLQMSGGCSFEVNGEKYRLSFLRPQNTRAGASGVGAVAGVASIGSGRAAGKRWRSVLPG